MAHLNPRAGQVSTFTGREGMPSLEVKWMRDMLGSDTHKILAKRGAARRRRHDNKAAITASLLGE